MKQKQLSVLSKELFFGNDVQFALNKMKSFLLLLFIVPAICHAKNTLSTCEGTLCMEVSKNINDVDRSISRNPIDSIGKSFVKAELSTQLEKYKNICLKERQYIGEKNMDGLNSCKRDFDSLRIKEIPSNVFTPLQQENFDFTGHIQFTAQYLDSLIVQELNRLGINKEIHIIHKGKKYDVLISHKIVPAKSSLSYSFIGYGKQEFLVICEEKANIQLGINHEVTNTKYISDTTENGTCEYTWNMGETQSSCIMTIINNEEKPLCCVIVSN